VIPVEGKKAIHRFFDVRVFTAFPYGDGVRVLFYYEKAAVTIE
jgi:hypothetical protein